MKTVRAAALVYSCCALAVQFVPPHSRERRAVRANAECLRLFSEIPELGVCFSCFHFIEGDDAESRLSELSDDEAFNIGAYAGRDLRKLNSIRPIENVSPWAERKKIKHQAYVKAYRESGFTFREETEIFAYIDAEMDLMNGAENLFLHDDFHVGNLIVCNRQYNGVIDFNRMDWGDYAHEFVKLGWFSRYKSEAFANGQVTGYFGESVPEEFWNRYSLYMAMSLYSTIVWHWKYYPGLLDGMRNYIDMVLDDHDSFRRSKPKWMN